MKKLNLSLLGTLLALSGCGGAPDNTQTKTGVFLDSPISNIGYKTETLEDTTNSLGEFKYIEGETVTFFIGDLEFPQATASSTVTPLDLAGSGDTYNTTVVNIIRLLQTLDEDGNPDNGITITEAAKTLATQLDFKASMSDFESSADVVDLVANSGAKNTVLITPEDAITHFEGSLNQAGKAFISSTGITGVWSNKLTDNDLLILVFFNDGTYVHLEVDEQAPLDETDETSGMEWGTYSRNSETGQLTVAQTFDGNGDTGLTDAANGETTIFAHASNNVLTLQFDDNQNGIIDDDESIDFNRESSSNLSGVWKTSLTDNDLLAFIFFDDGTYVHLEVDEEIPLDQAGEMSGMEWGTYSKDNATGQLTVTQTFDGNGDTGLTDAANGETTIFAQVSGDTLTLQFDDDQNGMISEDEYLDFNRAVNGFTLDMTQHTAHSVITFSACPSAPLGFDYSFTHSLMTRTGSDNWDEDNGCTTSPAETMSLEMATLAADFDIPFNCAAYPICTSTDFNKTFSGIEDSDDPRPFTATYSFDQASNVITYTYTAEGTTISEVITIQ